MRILREAGILLVIVAAVLATAVGALGAKPEHPVKPPTTTTTVPEEPTLGGYTCAEYYEGEYDAMLAEHEVAFGDNTIEFRLSGKKDFVCLDVNWDTGGTWEVDAIGNEGTTQIGRLLLVPRDSYAPGDECARVDLRNVTLPLVQQLPHPDDPDHELILASTVNACGTQFGEWIDGVLVTTATGDSHPLAFFAQLIAGGSGASVVVTVTLP